MRILPHFIRLEELSPAKDSGIAAAIAMADKTLTAFRTSGGTSPKQISRLIKKFKKREKRMRGERFFAGAAGKELKNRLEELDLAHPVCSAI